MNNEENLTKDAEAMPFDEWVVAVVEFHHIDRSYVLPESGIRSATEAVRVKDHYVMVSWPYYDLEQKLKYKAMEHGQKVITVDPKYTSQTCPKCGHVEAANRDKQKHIFCCRNCGYTSNDDRIGAMNLCRKELSTL